MFWSGSSIQAMTDTSLVGRSLGVLVEALGIPMLNDQKPGTQVRSSFHLMRKSNCSIHSAPPRPQAKAWGCQLPHASLNSTAGHCVPKPKLGTVQPSESCCH